MRHLEEILHTSPYLSSKGRRELGWGIAKQHEGRCAAHAKELLFAAVADEIATLLAKFSNLGIKSSKITELEDLQGQHASGALDCELAQKRLYELMGTKRAGAHESEAS